MIAAPRAWRSPLSGAPLHADTPHSLRDAETRWPVVDGIAFLRVERDELRERTLHALDAGDRTAALVALLAERDDWAPGAAPAESELRYLVANVDVLSFREAMERLAYGPVAPYFAHRFGDPTYLAGLALLAAHRPAHGRSLEIACGIGHYLRELGRVGVEATGVDVVFSKLWLAHHYVAPHAELACFDVAYPWPIDDAAAHLVHCHDAFYFFANKKHVADEMRRLAGTGGTLLVSHAHNRAVENLSAGDPLDAQTYVALFDARVAYDDADLTRALIEMRAPRPAGQAELERANAVALVAGDGATSARAVSGDVAGYAPGTRLRLNPLYAAQPNGAYRIRWPSDRYEAEYASLATYPAELPADCAHEVAAGASVRSDELIRRRAYVVVPLRW